MSKPRGRPTKPDAMKKQAGTLRPSRVKSNTLASATVNKTIESVPLPPDYLGPEGQKEWARIVDQLDRLGILAKTDYSLLAACCMEWEQYVVLRLELMEVRNSANQKSIDKGAYYSILDERKVVKNYQLHPRVYAANAHLKNYMDIARQFGFSPEARQKITMPDKPNDQDAPIKRLLKKAK